MNCDLGCGLVIMRRRLICFYRLMLLRNALFRFDRPLIGRRIVVQKMEHEQKNCSISSSRKFQIFKLLISSDSQVQMLSARSGKHLFMTPFSFRLFAFPRVFSCVLIHRKMEASVYSDVKTLSDSLGSRKTGISPSNAKRLIFERLLTWKGGTDRSAFPMPLAHFSLFFRWKGWQDKAKALDSGVEKLYSFDGGFPVDDVLIFLAGMAKVDEKRIQLASKPNMFAFSMVPSSLESPRKKEKILPYNELRLPFLTYLPPIQSTPADFPLLPSICCDKMEKDEGFSDGSSPIPALNDEVAAAEPLIQEAPWKKSRPNQHVSQLNSKDFDRFWTDLMHDGPYRLISSQRISETLSSPISFDEFKRCFQALVSGVSSWIFVRHDNSLVLESKVRIIGVSALSLRGLVQPGLDLGNCISGMHDHIKSLERFDSRKYPTLRAFRLGLMEVLRMFELETCKFCANSCGLVDLATKYEDYGRTFSMLTSLCGTVLSTKDFSANWLLDTLFDLCTEFRFSSKARAFLLTLFEYALRPHLELMTMWMTDMDTAMDAATGEFFIKVEKEALFYSDRRFWTDALTLREDKIPIVMMPVATKLLWLAKMSCVLHQLKIQGPKFTEDDVPKFSLTKPLSERGHDQTNEDSLDEMVTGIRKAWQENIDSMNQFVSVKAIFGRSELMNLCAALRSTFLFSDGDFSASLVEKLFDMISTVNDKIDDPREFFDPSLLIRALEGALKSKTLSKDVAKLDFSFAIQAPAEKKFVDQLSVFDHLKLNCDIPWPANIVLTESVMDWYRKPFGILLKLELTLWTLTTLRRRLLKLGSRDNGLLYHRTLMQLREIDLFARNLRTYLLHQVAEVSWTKFTKKISDLEEGEEFDAMYDIHNRYVGDFVNRCLLNPKAKKLLNVVEKLLKDGIDFGMVALSFAGEDEICGHANRGLAEKMMKTEALHVSFTRTLKLFYSVLCKLASRGYQPHLTDLLLQMNFNYHYDDEKQCSLSTSSI